MACCGFRDSSSSCNGAPTRTAGNARTLAPTPLLCSQEHPCAAPRSETVEPNGRNSHGVIFNWPSSYTTCERETWPSGPNCFRYSRHSSWKWLGAGEASHSKLQHVYTVLELWGSLLFSTILVVSPGRRPCSCGIHVLANCWVRVFSDETPMFHTLMNGQCT